MSGEIKASQLSGSLDARCVQLFSGNTYGPMVVSVHDAPVPGIGDSVTLIASMPYKARLAYFGYQRTGGAAAAGTCKLNFNIATDISEVVTVSDSLRFRTGLAVDVPKGATVNFTRTTATNSGKVICFWILLSEAAEAAVKSSALAPAVSLSHTNLTLAAGDLQMGWISSHIVDCLGGVPADVQLFNANFPVDSQLVAVIAGDGSVETGGVASTLELRTDVGGGGVAISETLSGVNRNKIGLGLPVTVNASDSLYARGTVSVSYNWILCIWKSVQAAIPALPGVLAPSQYLIGLSKLAGQPTSDNGLPFVSTHTMVAGGGADDITLFTNMPVKAGTSFVIVSPTAGGDSMGPHPYIRNDVGGAGDALCENLTFGFGASILETVRSAGMNSANSVAAGAPAYLNRPKGMPEGDLLVFWVPMS